MQLTGDRAKLVKGYREVILAASFSVTDKPTVLGVPQFHFTAKVVTSDFMWSRFPPFTLGLWMGKSWWVWDDVIPDGDCSPGGVIEAKLIGAPRSIQSL